MRIVRALVLVLVLLNLILFAAGRGFFGRSGSGEPERLANQITPERIRIVDAGKTDSSPVSEQAAPFAPQAASAPAATTASDARPTSKADAKEAAHSESKSEPAVDADVDACRRYAPLSRDQAARITGIARTGDTHVKASQKSLEEPSSFWVYIPPTANRQDMDKHVGELKSAGISDWFVQPNGADKGGISLGLFKTDGMATILRDRLRSKGVTGVRVQGRESANAKEAVELTAKSHALEALKEQIAAALPGAAHQECAGAR